MLHESLTKLIDPSGMSPEDLAKRITRGTLCLDEIPLPERDHVKEILERISRGELAPEKPAIFCPWECKCGKSYEEFKRGSWADNWLNGEMEPFICPGCFKVYAAQREGVPLLRAQEEVAREERRKHRKEKEIREIKQKAILFSILVLLLFGIPLVTKFQTR